MAKSKKPSKTISEYRRVRKNLKQNIRRLEERGYDVSKIKLPEIPEKITSKDVTKLKNINSRRYKLATHETEVIKNKGKKNERIETIKVKGTEFQKVERKISQEKAKATRRENKIKKQEIIEAENKRNLEKINIPLTEPISIDYDYEDVTESVPEIPYTPTKSFGKIGEIPMVQLVDIETGEVIEGPAGVTKWKNRNVKELKDFQMELAMRQYDIAKKNLSIMSSYEGRDKHARVTRFNADSIANFLDSEMSKNPVATAAKLQAFNESGAFESVDYIYREGGYERFLYEWVEALDYPNFYGDIEDDEYEDYDE